MHEDSANEDSEHFLLHCPFFEEARRDLLGSLSDIIIIMMIIIIMIIIIIIIIIVIIIIM